MKNIISHVAMGAVGLLIVGTLAYGGYIIEKKVNWSMSYKASTVQQICSMVKHEMLEDPNVCAK